MAKVQLKKKVDTRSADLFRKAEQTSLKGSIDEAILLYKKALRLTRRRDSVTKARALRSLGSLCWRKGELRKAMDYLEKGLSVSKSAGDLTGVAQAYNCMGAICFDTGKWSKVKNHFTRALKAAERSGDQKLTAHLCNNMGAVSNLRGRLDEALSSFRKAERLYRKLEDTRGLARVYNNLGLMYRDRGDWKKAAEHYQKCTKLSGQCDDHSLRANSTLNYVQVLIELSRFTAARKKVDEALEILMPMGEVAPIAEAMMLYGMIYTREKKLALAEKQFAESSVISEKLNNLLGKAECFREMAMMYKERGDKKKTLEYFGKASRMFRALKAETYLKGVTKQAAAIGAA